MYFIVFLKQAFGNVVACLKSNINMSRALTSADRTMQVNGENAKRGKAVEKGWGGGCKRWETDSTSCYSFSIVSFPTWPWRTTRVNVWIGKRPAFYEAERANKVS